MKVISGNTNTSVKALLTAAGKNTLRYVHDNYGFDFEKPFILERLTEKFTINKVWSFIPHYLYDFTVVVIVKDNYHNEYNIVKITSNSIDIELPKKHNYDYKTRPYCYYRKGDFDIDRKAGKDCFIIAQENKYIQAIQEDSTTFEKNHRYIIIETDHSYLYFKDPEKQGKKEFYSNGQYIYSNRQKIFPAWFDKSGYYVIEQKERLQQQAKKLRTERQKEEYLLTDNTSKVKELKEKAQQAQKELINRLENAKDYGTASKAIDILYYDFRWILFEIDLYEKRTANKEYSSIDSSEKAYNNIMSKFEKLYEKLNGKEEKENENNF